MIKSAFDTGVVAGFQKFALSPPSKADSFVSKVDEGKDAPPPGGGGAPPGAGEHGLPPGTGGGESGNLPPEIVELLTQVLGQGGGAPPPAPAPVLTPGGESGGIPPELAAMLSQTLSGGGPGGS